MAPFCTRSNTADVEIDLVVAAALGHAGARRRAPPAPFRPAGARRDVRSVERRGAARVAVDHRADGHHFRVQPRPPDMSRRRNARACRSVQSIMGATANSNILIYEHLSFGLNGAGCVARTPFCASIRHFSLVFDSFWCSKLAFSPPSPWHGSSSTGRSPMYGSMVSSSSLLREWGSRASRRGWRAGPGSRPSCSRAR